MVGILHLSDNTRTYIVLCCRRLYFAVEDCTICTVEDCTIRTVEDFTLYTVEDCTILQKIVLQYMYYTVEDCTTVYVLYCRRFFFLT